MPKNPKARQGKGVRQTIQPYRVGSGQEQQVSGTRLGGAELTGWGIGQAWAFGQAGAINSNRSNRWSLAGPKL